ncbi:MULTISPECIES: MazG-like family protein [unclassified Streptomyces]|uniref:MazG-like family protein n=1 Tax=unclassified Streptomyces TaxID=2593676 RepID=UPI002250A4AF|nr:MULTISPECIES: MazG-like family protein [unclassified Streptomyces]MCX4408006.1 MazG-like family protein [Streptomyces sp. NBC_01764]MCX5187268.1 MazG-like family protein [Streptomyces sp. NBC_00268]
MSAALWPVTARIVTALNAANGTGDYEISMRLLKVMEEAGEATAAYIGMTGQNPRRGITHTLDDVADELCDVIIAATVALHAFTTAPPDVLDAKLHAVARRLQEVEVGPTAWPTPEDAYTTAPGITYEIAWTASTARTLAENRHGGDVDREYWLRKAALLDRIALEYEADGVSNGTGEVAANAARQLIEADQDGEADYSGAPYGPEHPATLAHPRGYVRQEYARWAQNQ